MSTLDGPRLPPLRAPATHLVVLCHGYGSDGNDLISLAPHWQSALPGAAFASPNAPERCAGSPMGYQWFPLSRIDPLESLKGAETAAPRLNEFLDAELERLVLGSMLHGGPEAEQALAQLDIDDFAVEPHREILRSMRIVAPEVGLRVWPGCAAAARTTSACNALPGRTAALRSAACPARGATTEATAPEWPRPKVEPPTPAARPTRPA